MLKGLALALAFGAAALDVGGAGSALAQQRGDPMGGQFGSYEIALPPAEAAQQAEAMGQALAGLQPQRPGVVDTYVLSAALWGEPVFENEAKEGAAILARHFDAEGRTIVLTAGRGGGPRTFAAATPANINAALGKIGQIIDPNEDLVVVFLTSHGGQDGTVGIQDRNRLGGGLKPLHLRTSLAQAGIRNKAVIISACFSGHFILPFDEPGAVVLTAAAADKTSFGCEPSNAWTYFGDALFNHSLRSGASLTSAYDASLGLITQWENKLIADWNKLPASQKKQTPEPLPSNPQSGIGDVAGALVARAEAYGMAVNCTAHLSFALDRARSQRPLKGLPDVAAITTLKTGMETRAASLGAERKRSPQDVAKAIAAASAELSKFFGQQPAEVAASAAACATAAGGGG